MTREELQPKAPIQCTSGQCYDKDEADKVMDAMEVRIKELELYDCRKVRMRTFELDDNEIAVILNAFYHY